MTRQALKRIPAVRKAWLRYRFGDLHRVAPLSDWGTERGTAVDRFYIEQYLATRAHLVRGRALEVKGDEYSVRFGASSVDVLDIDRQNARATVVGDVCDPMSLGSGMYDVAIITQTLLLVRDPQQAVHNLLTSLRPGGALLVTMPTASRLVNDDDRWRWTVPGMRHVLTTQAPPGAEVEVEGLGNGLALRAFLFGLSLEDLDQDVLQHVDPRYPVVVGGSVRLPEA